MIPGGIERFAATLTAAAHPPQVALEERHGAPDPQRRRRGAVEARRVAHQLAGQRAELVTRRQRRQQRAVARTLQVGQQFAVMADGAQRVAVKPRPQPAVVARRDEAQRHARVGQRRQVEVRGRRHAGDDGGQARVGVRLRQVVAAELPVQHALRQPQLEAVQRVAGQPRGQAHAGGEILGQVQLAVRDSGTGIPAEVLPHVFDPFFTTKRAGEGTGLGLAICLDIVRRHGGDISVQSSPETGSLFRVLLPNPSGLSRAENI